MYRSHYGLIHKPFQLNTDPRFLWLGEKHEEALATLKYGVMDQKGFLLMSGDVGTGKTTLINALLESIGQDTLVATIRDPALDLIEFFNMIALSFHIPETFRSKIDFIVYFNRFLKQVYAEHRNVLLIIDEVHSLSKEILEHIRLLSNIELPEEKLVNIFLVGQNEIHQTLALPECRALRQRISLVYHIEPLSEHETGSYISHRLKVAGTGQNIFTNEAVQEIHRCSMGYPRMINTLCDHALLTGYVRNLTTITPSIITECARQFLTLGGQPEPNSPVPLPEAHGTRPDPAHGPHPAEQQHESVAGKEASSLTVLPRTVPAIRQIRTKIIRAMAASNTFSWNGSHHKSRVWLSAGCLAVIVLCVVALYPKTPPQNAPPPAPLSQAPIPVLPDIPHTPSISNEPRIITPSKSSLALMEQARDALQRQDFIRSMALFKQIAEVSPDDLPIIKMDYSKALHGQAKRVIDEHPHEAGELLERAVAIDPQNAGAFFDLGRLYTTSQDYPKAIQAYQNAADLGYRPPETYYNLGFIYASIHEYEIAEQMLLHVVDLNPPYLDKALYNLAVVQHKQGKKQQCMDNLERAISSNPDNIKAERYLKQMKTYKDVTWLSVAK